MKNFISTIFGKMRRNKKNTSTTGYLNEMPEAVNYGEDSGAILNEEQEDRFE